MTSIYGYLQRPSMVDFSGHLAAVFFVSGCNFRCGFCHNPELLSRQPKGLSREALKKALAGFRASWVDAVVLTGGEPSLAEDLAELIAFFRREGFAVKLDSNGSRPEVLREVLPMVDMVAMDVKCSLEAYPEFVKFADSARIAESIALIQELAADYEFRTTVLPSVHTDEEMLAIASLIKGAKRYVLQPFMPHDNLPDPKLRTEARPSPDRMTALGKLLKPYVETLVVRGGTAGQQV
jgi:pyruvate formate lyase activating enzyme